MSAKIKIGIIGGGNMGTAIIGGIIKKYSVLVAENNKKQAAALKKKFRLKAQSIREVASQAKVVILAVKPQDFEAVLGEIKPYLSKQTLVISIAAGITISYIGKKLGKGIKIIRAMPNLPALIGLAMTAISKGKNVSGSELKLAVKIFESIGKVIIVGEKKINAITAVSGSGPAYVYLFIELFVEAARKIGFSLEEAIGLVGQTIYGSLELLEHTKQCPKDLRTRVTSKGGTTQAAMDVFFGKKIDKIFSEALKAAKNRAQELSRK